MRFGAACEMMGGGGGGGDCVFVCASRCVCFKYLQHIVANNKSRNAYVASFVKNKLNKN